MKEYIIQQNIHWKNKLYESGVEREKTKEIISLLKTKHIISILGVRRSGKSTVLKQIINHLINKGVKNENILFLNLESPLTYQYRNNPKNLQKIFETYLSLKNPNGKIYLFLDEIQFFKDWQVFVKDIYERENIKIFLTGSNSQIISEEISSILSGRSLLKTITPFNFKEILKIHNIQLNEEQLIVNKTKVKKIFNDFLNLGGFPEIVLEKKDYIKKEILTNYYKNILYQDIIPRFSVKKSNEIEKLLVFVLSNITKPYSYNSLSKIIKTSDKTAKEYMSFFEYSLMMFELNNFHYSVKKQENFPKKVYTIDNGFINTVSFSMQKDYGRILENLIFISLLNNNYEIFYYSHKNKGECDFVVREKDKIVKLIQVTNELDIYNEKRELNGLLAAMKEFKLKKAYIITENQEELKVIDNKKIYIIPAYKWLYL